ncbi:hypothetical protein ONA91_25975 [Micromonospora sp. DR5-3]|uniref:hypothetical protein n=1 Tax=unclassified Micromonospora TaxID=2617518 RepID=UPI001651E44B|nr:MULTISPECIES: hypothetical protein [unclassified Micromonospora]MCW3817903.1 hypothetical protein [Micromonospora sp. DR5-3]
MTGLVMPALPWLLITSLSRDRLPPGGDTTPGCPPRWRTCRIPALTEGHGTG